MILQSNCSYKREKQRPSSLEPALHSVRLLHTGSVGFTLHTGIVYGTHAFRVKEPPAGDCQPEVLVSDERGLSGYDVDSDRSPIASPCVSLVRTVIFLGFACSDL